MNRYPGGKNAQGTWQWLVDRMPPHSLYVEPFLGSGGTLRRKIPALRSVGIDRDSEVVAHWKRVRFPGLSVVGGCGIEWLAEHAEALAGSDALVYCDPPYLLSTRVKRNLYRCEMSARTIGGCSTCCLRWAVGSCCPAMPRRSTIDGCPGGVEPSAK